MCTFLSLEIFNSFDSISSKNKIIPTGLIYVHKFSCSFMDSNFNCTSILHLNTLNWLYNLRLIRHTLSVLYYKSIIDIKKQVIFTYIQPYRYYFRM